MSLRKLLLTTALAAAGVLPAASGAQASDVTVWDVFVTFAISRLD